jgi:hypothetical protein
VANRCVAVARADTTHTTSRLNFDEPGNIRTRHNVPHTAVGSENLGTPLAQTAVDRSGPLDSPNPRGLHAVRTEPRFR